MKVAINIAAYEEALNIAPVIAAAKRYGEVFVVDDGSPNNTADVARRAGARVVRHPLNLGQGAAIITGFKAVIAGDFDVVVNMDADGQHDPGEIPVLVEAMATRPGVHIVVGSRFLGANHGDATWARRVFLPPLTKLINRLTGYELTDSMCGFRAFRVDALRTAVPVLDQMLEPQYLSAEMFMRFSRLGFKLEEVPVHLKDRAAGVSTKGLVRYGFGVSRAIMGTLLNPTRGHADH